MAKAFDSKKWEGHVEAARREGKAIRRYAAEHGLSAWSMYSARQQLIKRQAAPASKPSAPSVPVADNGFATVRLAPLPAPLRAQLPNGVMLELAIGAGDSATLVAAISMLAKLPCSV
jgi:transposase-like protein